MGPAAGGGTTGQHRPGLTAPFPHPAPPRTGAKPPAPGPKTASAPQPAAERAAGAGGRPVADGYGGPRTAGSGCVSPPRPFPNRGQAPGPRTGNGLRAATPGGGGRGRAGGWRSSRIGGQAPAPQAGNGFRVATSGRRGLGVAAACRLWGTGATAPVCERGSGGCSRFGKGRPPPPATCRAPTPRRSSTGGARGLAPDSGRGGAGRKTLRTARPRAAGSGRGPLRAVGWWNRSAPGSGPLRGLGG